MTEPAGIQIEQKELPDHPAVGAWCELRQQREIPARLVQLEGDNPTTAVYRLEKVGIAGSDVIAKRCFRSSAQIECTVYEQVLPKLPFPMLHYYGRVDEPESKFGWLFLEDVGGERYHPHIREHRLAAARWLGVMHTSASANATARAAASCLPDRGSEHYLSLLQSECDLLRSSFAIEHLLDEDRELLETIVAHCERLMANWVQIEHVCDGMPRTLVHGDFISKNVHIRSSRESVVFLPFDWEKAGWGVPAEDISGVNIKAYWSIVQDRWPGLSVLSLEKLARAGKAFRWIVFLDWLAPRLKYQSTKESMDYMRSYASWLTADLARAANWSD